MPKIKALSIPFWTIAILLAALNLIIFNAIMLTSATQLQVQYIPDDGYYYLTLARNFSLLGFWTFDAGVSVTSGFHPLFAYLLSGSFSLFQLNPDNFVRVSILLGLSLTLATIRVIWGWGVKDKNALFLMFLTLLISSQNFVYNIVSITEWSLTILIASAYCVSFFTKYRKSALSRLDFLLLFILGTLGSVTRSDFGLLPLSITFATFAATFIWPAPKSKALLAFAGLAGTIIGLLIVFGHNYLFTHEFLQSSAKMKAYWAQFGSPNYFVVPFLVQRIIGSAGLLLLAVLITMAIYPKFSKARKIEPMNLFSLDQKVELFIMLGTAGLCVLGFMLVYSHNAAIQPWYTANLLLPMLLLIFAISNYITPSLDDKSKFLVALLFLIGLIFNISHLYPLSNANAPWPHQKFTLDAGIYLSENRPDCKVGAWNAGIIGYYEGGHVVNLDGLVNNDIYFYATHGDLPTYLSSKNICYIVDFENMLSNEFLRVRGGYNDPGFLGLLEPQMVFDHSAYGLKNLTLYHIRQPQPIGLDNYQIFSP